MAIFGGEFLPVVLEVSRRLETAKAQLVAVTFDETASGQLQREQAQEQVRHLEQLMAAAQLRSIHHVIDLVECIPEDLTNYTLIREALTYLTALASLGDKGALT